MRNSADQDARQVENETCWTIVAGIGAKRNAELRHVSTAK